MCSEIFLQFTRQPGKHDRVHIPEKDLPYWSPSCEFRFWFFSLMNCEHTSFIMLTALDHLNTPSADVKSFYVVRYRYKVGRKFPKDYTRKGDGEKILKGICPPCSKLRKVQPVTAGAFKERDNPPNTLVCPNTSCLESTRTLIHPVLELTLYIVLKV